MAIGAVDDSRDGSLAIVRNVETEVVVVVVKLKDCFVRLQPWF